MIGIIIATLVCIIVVLLWYATLTIIFNTMGYKRQSFEGTGSTADLAGQIDQP